MEKTSPKSVLQQALLTIICLGLVTVQACSVSHALHGQPGTDLASIRPGATRSDVDAILGAPARGWQLPTGVRYEVYRYDPGMAPSVAEASGHAIIDVATLGLWEIPMKQRDYQPPKKPDPKQVAISFDSEERVVGVFPDFGDFDALPTDGRTPRNSPPSPH